MDRRPFVPIAVHALAPAEHEAALSVVARAEQLGTEMESTVRSVEGLELDLGKLLSEIIDNRWFMAVRGLPLKDWVEANFRSRDGKPMTDGLAKNLARDWRVIHTWPEVEALLRNGDPKRGQVTCRTAAYYGILLAQEADWEAQEVEKYLETSGISDATLGLAKAHAVKAVRDKLMGWLYTRSAREIRDDYFARRDAIRINEGIGSMEWVRVKSVLAKPVADRKLEVLRRLALLADEEVSRVEKLSYTAETERLVGFAEDFLDAAEAFADGDPLRMESLLAQVKEHAPKLRAGNGNATSHVKGVNG